MLKKPLRSRSRLLTALLLGVVTAVGWPASEPWRLRAVYGWDVAGIAYLGLTLLVMARSPSPDELRTSAAREDQGRWIILILMVSAAFISMLAIGTLLANTKNLPALAAHWHILAAALTVIASWSVMHTIFAVHYTHHYYGDTDSAPGAYAQRGGLQFPGSDEPLFGDFIYYAFVIGMTCQVSDVQITGRGMRRLSTVHGILSFFFNTIVLALSVNIAAGLVS